MIGLLPYLLPKEQNVIFCKNRKDNLGDHQIFIADGFLGTKSELLLTFIRGSPSFHVLLSDSGNHSQEAL